MILDKNDEAVPLCRRDSLVMQKFMQCDCAMKVDPRASTKLEQQITPCAELPQLTLSSIQAFFATEFAACPLEFWRKVTSSERCLPLCASKYACASNQLSDALTGAALLILRRPIHSCTMYTDGPTLRISCSTGIIAERCGKSQTFLEIFGTGRRILESHSTTSLFA